MKQLHVTQTRDDIRRQHALLQQLEEVEAISIDVAEITLSNSGNYSGGKRTLTLHAHGLHSNSPDYMVPKDAIFRTKLKEARAEYIAWLRERLQLKESEAERA